MPNYLTPEEKNALYMQRGQPPEAHYGQALPELPSSQDPVNAFLRRHPTAARFLPDGGTINSVVNSVRSFGGSEPAEASPGGVSTVPKNIRAPSLEEMHRKGRAGAIRGALNLPPDLGEYETLLHDFADGQEGRVVAERLLRDPGDPEALNMARQAFLARLKGE